MTGRGGAGCGLVGAIVLVVCLGGVATAAEQNGVVVRLVHKARLVPPPGEFLSAIASGEQLLVPDFTTGHVIVYDLLTGQRIGQQGRLGRRPGELVRPLAVFPTARGFGVFDAQRYRIVLFDKSWTFLHEIETARPPASSCFFFGVPLWLDDRIVGLGVVSEDLCGGLARTFLYSVRRGCTVQPLLWDADDRASWHLGSIGPAQGGVTDVGSAGWVFLDPWRFEFHVFDRTDRLVRRFPGDRSKWRTAAFSAAPSGQGREAYFNWLADQPMAFWPFALGGSLVGVIVRSQPESGAVGHFLEIYDAARGLLASRCQLALPTDKERYVLPVGEVGARLTVLMRESWHANAPTDIWHFVVDTPGVEPPPSVQSPNQNGSAHRP